MIAYPRVALKSVVSIGPPVECQLGVVFFSSADNDRQRWQKEVTTGNLDV